MRASVDHRATGRERGENGGVAHPRPQVAGPGQESVWDYPRPPRVEPARAPVEVRVGDKVIARSEPGFAGFADELTLLELVADFDIDRTQVAIECE